MAEDNFLEGYCRLHDGTEVPSMFAMWCGLSAASAAMGRNSWLKAGSFTVYPNLFIVLVGASGKVRKSTAINQAEELLRLMQPGPNMIAQKLSPEALIQSVRKVETTDTTRLLAETCSGFVVADELSTFLNKKSYEAGLASLLISMYDCKPKFEYKTISRGVEEINNACLGMLAGSTIDWIRSGIPEEAVGGGLTSRIIFVYVDTPMPPVPWPADTPEKRALKDRLVRQLGVISTIKGDFRFDDGGFRYYHNEYLNFYNDTGSALYGEKTSEGYASRRANHILKIAMILSACEGSEMIIRENHVRPATMLVTEMEKFLRLVLSLITSNNHGSDVSGVLGYIQRGGERGITRSELMRLVANKMSSRQLGEVIDSLILSQQIDIGQSHSGTFYRARRG